MSDMVERVARALCLSRKNVPNECYREGFKEEFVNKNWHLFVDDARAAINAMYEPTPNMVEEAACLDGQSTAVAVWHAMIETALKE